VLGNTTIVAEFVSDDVATRFAEQSAISASQPMSSQPSQWSGHNSVYRQQSVGGVSANRGGAVSGSNDVSSWGAPPTMVPGAHSSNCPTVNHLGWGPGGQSSGGLWGGMGGIEEHSASLLGNMLGESM